MTVNSAAEAEVRSDCGPSKTSSKGSLQPKPVKGNWA